MATLTPALARANGLLRLAQPAQPFPWDALTAEAPAPPPTTAAPCWPSICDAVVAFQRGLGVHMSLMGPFKGQGYFRLLPPERPATVENVRRFVLAYNSEPQGPPGGSVRAAAAPGDPSPGLPSETRGAEQRAQGDGEPQEAGPGGSRAVTPPDPVHRSDPCVAACGDGGRPAEGLGVRDDRYLRPAAPSGVARGWPTPVTPAPCRIAKERADESFPAPDFQLQGMERLVDSQSGANLFRHSSLRGLPDLAVEGDGYILEFIGSTLLCLDIQVLSVMARLLAETVKAQLPIAV